MLIYQLRNYGRRKTAFSYSRCTDDNREILFSMKMLLSAVDIIAARVSGKPKCAPNSTLNPIDHALNPSDLVTSTYLLAIDWH